MNKAQRIQEIITSFYKDQEEAQSIFHDTLKHQLTLHPLLSDSGVFPIEFRDTNEITLKWATNKTEVLKPGYSAQLTEAADYSVSYTPSYLRFSKLIGEQTLVLGRDNLLEHLEGDWAVYLIPLVAFFESMASSLLRTGRFDCTDPHSGVRVLTTLSGAGKVIQENVQNYERLLHQLGNQDLSTKTVVIGDLAGLRPAFVEELKEWQAQGRLERLIQVRAQQPTPVSELTSPGKSGFLWLSEPHTSKESIWPVNEITVCDRHMGQLVMVPGEHPRGLAEQGWLRFSPEAHENGLIYQVGTAGLIIGTNRNVSGVTYKVAPQA